MRHQDPLDGLSPEVLLDIAGAAPRPRIRSRFSAAPVYRQPIEQRLEDLIQRAGWLQDMLVALKQEYLLVQAEINAR